MGPNSKHVAVSSNPIGNKIGDSTTHFRGRSTKNNSTHQDNFYIELIDLFEKEFVTPAKRAPSGRKHKKTSF